METKRDVVEKAKEIAEDFIQDYKEASKQKKLPSLHLEIKQGREEFYEARYYARSFHVQASDWRTLAFAIHTLKISALSGHYADFLGEKKPQFRLRPVWVECDIFFKVDENIAWAIPRYLKENETRITTFAKRMIAFGYNAIIFGMRDLPVSEPGQPFHLERLFLTLQGLGIKIIVKPIFLAKGKELDKRGFLEAVRKIPRFDYLFIERGSALPYLFRGRKERDFTSADLAEEEVKFFEEFLGNQQSLIYYVSSADEEASRTQAEWLPRFCDEVGPRTIIAFSAVAGDPTWDHALPHPLWASLRKSLPISTTPLMPIVNAGNVNQGEGLWPTLTLGDIDYYFQHCQHHLFAGMIHLVNQLPQPGAVLDCLLWTTSQPTWNKLSVNLLAETWFSACRPEMCYLNRVDIWQKNREIAADLSLMRSLIQEKKREKVSPAVSKALLESLLARLHFVQEKVRNTADKSLYFENYCLCFIRDAKRMVHHFLHCLNISIGTILQEEDFGPSFWTSIRVENTPGLRGSPKVSLLDTPNPAAFDSFMKGLYNESRLFNE